MKGNQVRASAEGTGLRQMDLVRPDLDLSTEYMAFIEMCTRKLLHPSSQALLYRVRQNDLLVVI